MNGSFHKLLVNPVTRFLIVGAAATVTQFAILIVLVEFANVPEIAAPVLSYGGGAVLNYALNRSFTFRSNAAHRTAVPRFALMVITGLTLNTLIFTLLHSVGLYYILAQAITTLTVLIFNYTVASRWVFVGQDRARDEP